MPLPVRIRPAYVFLTVALLLSWITAKAATRKEFSELDSLYKNGKLNELSEALSSLKPNNDDERGSISYYNAMLKTATVDFVKAHQNVLQLFPRSFYAQRSLLEIGKVFLLDRNLDEAKTTLRKIVSPDLAERFYWLALCSWWQDDFVSAIANAENYLRIEPGGDYTESAHYLIADSYLEQKKAYSAVATLTKLQKLRLPDLDEQYLHYRLGFAYEQSDKLVDAVSSYQKGYEIDKYSQVAYLIEDRLFELRNRSRNIDISFLYPYSLLQIVDKQDDPESADSTNTKPLIPGNQVVQPNSNPLPTPGSNNHGNNNGPVKLKAKPTVGYWLQAGRFSMEANANKLVVNIRLMNLPAAYYEDSQGGKKSWVVLCGDFPDKAQAENARQALAGQNINSFITSF